MVRRSCSGLARAWTSASTGWPACSGCTRRPTAITDFRVQLTADPAHHHRPGHRKQELRRGLSPPPGIRSRTSRSGWVAATSRTSSAASCCAPIPGGQREFLQRPPGRVRRSRPGPEGGLHPQRVTGSIDPNGIRPPRQFPDGIPDDGIPHWCELTFRRAGRGHDGQLVASRREPALLHGRRMGSNPEDSHWASPDRA